MHILDDVLALDPLLEETEDSSCGALVVFGGIVRDHHEGETVDSMSYTAYRPLAEKVLQELEDEVLEKFAVARCRIVHRIGHLDVGEVSVYVVIRAAHRDAGFEAAKWAMDTLKERVPIWKQDFYPDGRSEYQAGTPLKQKPQQEDDDNG